MGPVSTRTILTSRDMSWFRDGPSLSTAARGAAAALARRIGLDSHRVAEVAIAVTEAATNVQRHATDGALLLRTLHTQDEAAVEFVTVDSGPGMVDVTASLADGASSAGTLGIGLGAVARLADHFDVHSVPGKGTVMAAQFWSRQADGQGVAAALTAGRQCVSGMTRPISGEITCGDAWSARLDTVTDTGTGTGTGTGTDPGHPAVLVMMCDGLGHGPLAARASAAAVEAFHDTPATDPEGIMRAVHRALRGTRGGAAAVARIEPAARRVQYCGVGNISGFLIGHDTRKTLISVPGIVGANMRRLRTFEEPLPEGGALTMHSDGLTERWDHMALPGLLHHAPLVVAGQLLREAGVRRDDASVVVVKGVW
ncbi:ATP-binding SpoIIE family protein phosphatase [Streptomyces sp. NPDC056486]|uniref:ATP-binding SpoIIE family protein phosphatase n=1 Tax=Streptomyces sp. NPDC056486 TaxID=3345835 RepID=UPI0036CDAC7C